jgi:hypothetical protein
VPPSDRLGLEDVALESGVGSLFLRGLATDDLSSIRLLDGGMRAHRGWIEGERSIADGWIDGRPAGVGGLAVRAGLIARLSPRVRARVALGLELGL